MTDNTDPAAALQQMSEAYRATQPVSPQDKLTAFYADDAKRTGLEAGNVDILREFNELATAAAAFNAPEVRDQAALRDHLMSVGLPGGTPVGDEVSKYVAGELAITPELRAEVDAKVESWKRDPAFMKRLFEGDPEAARLLNIASAMRLAPVKQG
ncbi:hypothetical protein [Bradyrhizobium sp. STM 3557]|uniref:hypothetical protein n=1 Tax=Bradyrhizobium sp. STM 3557 TaxID=578920 RepID=UPI00389090D3